MGEGKKASQPSRRLKNKRRNLRKEKGTRRTGGQASSQSSGEPDRGTPPGAGTGEPGRLGAPHHGAPWTGLGAAAAHTPLGGSGHERPGRRPRPVPGAPGPPAPAAGARQASTREDQGGVRYAPSVLTSPSHPAQWALPRRASPHFSGLQSAALPPPSLPSKRCAWRGGGGISLAFPVPQREWARPSPAAFPGLKHWRGPARDLALAPAQLENRAAQAARCHLWGPS